VRVLCKAPKLGHGPMRLVPSAQEYMQTKMMRTKGYEPVNESRVTAVLTVSETVYNLVGKARFVSEGMVGQATRRQMTIAVA
jgi:hypothetical protein